jgi:DNA polymerase
MDARAELKELIGSARALLEQYEATGCDGVVAEGGVAQTLALLDARPARPAAPRIPPLAARPAARPTAPMPPPGPAPAVPPTAPPAAAPRPEATVALPTLGPALPLEDRKRRLATLADAMRGCTACGLSAGRTQTVYARGNPAAELVFIGEAPGADEDRLGEPFVGKAGQLLDKMIAAMGYGRDDVYVCNVTKCRPPDNRKPEPLEMATCLPHLHEQLAVVQPRVIVALGATAVQGLLGATDGITRLRGTWKLYRGTIPVMPTFHPAYLLRDASKKADVWKDLQAVMQHLGKALPRRGAPPQR